MELEKIYNKETCLAVREFIKDFQAIFPGLLSEEELINRITKYMKHNINFNADLDENVMGEYTKNQVFIGKDVKEKGQVLFHEMIHVITDGEFLRNFVYRNFIEGLTTLAEELYVKYKDIKMPKYRRNVNGYVPTFVRELNFVKNGELLREFIKDPSGVYKVFLPDILRYNVSFMKPRDKDYLSKMESFADTNELITLMAKDKKPDSELEPFIKRIEDDVFKQYITGVCTKRDKFDSLRYLELYEMQMYPNLEMFIVELRNMYRDGLISIDDITKCGKLAVFYTLSEKSNISIGEIDADLSKFDDAELEWLASKVFGFNGYLYDTTSLFSKVEDIDLDKMYEEREYYEEVMPIYKQLIVEVINGELDLESIEDCRLRRTRGQKDSFNAYEYLLNTDANRVDKLFDVIFESFEDKVGTYCLEDSSGIQLVKDGEFFYYPCSPEELFGKVLGCKSINKEILYNYVLKYDNYGVLYLDRAVEVDLDDFGACDVTMFIDNGSELLKVKLSLKDGKVVENISTVTFMEDGKSVFEKDTEKKLKRKE